MAYLLHILAAIAIQALGEGTPGLGWRSPLAVIALAAVPHLLARRARSLALRGAFRSADLCARAVQHAPVLLHLAAVALFGWVQSVQSWTGAEGMLLGWPRPELLLALAPYLHYELVAIDAFSRAHELPARDRSAARRFQLRVFLSTLAPFAVGLLLAGLAGWNETLRVRIEHLALLRAAVLVAFLFAIAMVLPAIVRAPLDTAPLGPGPIRDQFEAVAKRAGFRARALLEWRTDNLMANAMILGFHARHRVVLFTDSLLTTLGPRELAAVFAHEIGHARRHHFAILLAWIVAFLLGSHLLAGWLASDEGALHSWQVAAGTFVVLGVFSVWLSRRFELEADLYALELLGDPLGMIAALERVDGRLHEASGLRHFSTARRAAFLGRAAAQPGFVRRFRGMLRRIAAVGVGLAILLAFLEVRVLTASWENDWIAVELALGRYASAVERARAVESLEERRAAQVAEAGQLAQESGSDPGRAQILEALRASLAAGDVERALAQAELLELRDAPGASALARSLAALAAGDSDLVRRELLRVDSEWLPWLEPLVANGSSR